MPTKEYNRRERELKRIRAAFAGGNPPEVIGRGTGETIKEFKKKLDEGAKRRNIPQGNYQMQRFRKREPEMIGRGTGQTIKEFREKLDEGAERKQVPKGDFNFKGKLSREDRRKLKRQGKG